MLNYYHSNVPTVFSQTINVPFRGYIMFYVQVYYYNYLNINYNYGF